MPPTGVTIGIRSDLLRRRPDVRSAERQLAAATANIGVAIASFFPSFTFSGDIGLQSLQFRKLFQGRSLTWAIGGDIMIPIFRGGNLIGNLHLAEAQATSAAFTYQKSVIISLQQAESALIAYTQELQASDLLTIAVDRYENLISITNDRYTKGLVSLTDLLDVERQWNAAEQNLLTSQTAALIDLITLYKSLGGGWQEVDCLRS
jgi:multidrug efflux system outer membrane protein